MANKKQIELVFKIDGKLSEIPWKPYHSNFNGKAYIQISFPFYYIGLPKRIKDSSGNAGVNYRTVITNLFEDDFHSMLHEPECSWFSTARISNRGICKCPFSGLVKEKECDLCNKVMNTDHGQVFIGDGWHEVVYQKVFRTS